MVSDQTIFATYQNAGVRVFDISDTYPPGEIATLVPPALHRCRSGNECSMLTI